MTKARILIAMLGASLLVAPSLGWADRWDVRREIAEGDREIRHERREAAREILNADSVGEARREYREGRREIRHERREQRREVRREIRQNRWGY